MITHWCEQRIDYDGSQLRAHWLLDRFALCGDACVGFRGACHVVAGEMADLADLGGPGIAADDMVHFLWEEFSHPDLLLATHRQRLLAAQAGELLAAMGAPRCVREGDDLYVAGRKLSISIATLSPVSALLHFAVNATPGGAPVPTISLVELGVEPMAFGRALLERIAAEQASVHHARAKVRSKGEWRVGKEA